MSARVRPRTSRVEHKVLNNNVVIVVDGSGRERVLMGRGLGFGLEHDDGIDPTKVQKTFVLDEGADSDHARQVLAAATYPVIEAVTAAVEGAERALGRDLGRHIALAIIDHIQFVLGRLAQRLRVPTTALPHLGAIFPDEYAAAATMAKEIGAALSTRLPDEEAIFLTMHVLNATRDEPNGTAALLLRRVQHVVSTVESALGVTLDTESFDYARFVLHVQFLLQRLVSRSMLENTDGSFFEFAKHSYPRSFAIAQKVKLYVRKATGSDLTDEETLYLVVHVERLAHVVAKRGLPEHG